MTLPSVTEVQVDAIISELLTLHSDTVSVDIPFFHDLLKHSLSLSTIEKKRVVDAVPTLSQYQFDELVKVFSEERDKFRELAKDYPDDIKKLLAKQQTEWLQLGDMYKSEIENKAQESENQKKQEEIKKSL